VVDIISPEKTTPGARGWIEAVSRPKTETTNLGGLDDPAQRPHPEGFQDLLQSTVVAHVATIGPEGETQNNPVWFAWDGEYVMFSQTKTRQKQRNPKITLSIADPENHLRYLEIRGIVERVEEGPDSEFINSLSEKYLGVYPYQDQRPGDERIVVFVRPRHTTHKDG
jgi:PPOX class probable F420-dependent enzyme